jgi:hypothetical protein
MKAQMEQFVIAPEMTVRHALECINKNTSVALVVDADQRLLGTRRSRGMIRCRTGRFCGIFDRLCHAIVPNSSCRFRVCRADDGARAGKGSIIVLFSLIDSAQQRFACNERTDRDHPYHHKALPTKVRAFAPLPLGPHLVQ